MTDRPGATSTTDRPAPRAPKQIGFVHLVPFDRENPRQGHLDGIELFRYAESLGLDSGWVRTRHMQHGLSSPAVFFGALSQQTHRIGLGTAVIPAGFENPFRLAEDLATADVLTDGRLQLGLSVHPPGYADAVNDLVYGGGWRDDHYDYDRIARLRTMLAGRAIREIPEYQGIGGDFDSDRVEPHSPGLANRLWYGGGSLRSARWAGSAGLNWLVSNISSTENGITEFSAAQRAQIDAFRAARAERDAGVGAGAAGAAGAAAGETAATPGRGGEPAPESEGRVAVARVIVPLDGATLEQARKYRAYVEARTPRTERVHGRNTIIARDLLGSADEIVEAILADAAFQAADDYLFELPFEFELADWQNTLGVIASRIGPALGWRPAA